MMAIVLEPEPESFVSELLSKIPLAMELVCVRIREENARGNSWIEVAVAEDERRIFGGVIQLLELEGFQVHIGSGKLLVLWDELPRETRVRLGFPELSESKALWGGL